MSKTEKTKAHIPGGLLFYVNTVLSVYLEIITMKDKIIVVLTIFHSYKILSCNIINICAVFWHYVAQTGFSGT